jgi:hypothetical protein
MNQPYLSGRTEYSFTTLRRHFDDLRKRISVRCRAEFVKYLLVRVVASVSMESDFGKQPEQSPETVCEPRERSVAVLLPMPKRGQVNQLLITFTFSRT